MTNLEYPTGIDKPGGRQINPKHPPWALVIDQNPKDLAETLGNLPYNELAAFLDILAQKLGKDSVKDRVGGKPQLASALLEANQKLHNTALSVRKAWANCEPHME